MCLGGLRGLRGRARGHSGAGASAEKLESNQHRVELPRPNLQVTPRGDGGGSGSSGSDQSPQQLGAPLGREEASSAHRHCHPSAQLGGPGLGGRSLRARTQHLPCPQRRCRRAGGRPRVRAVRRAAVSPPTAGEHWRCAWLPPWRLRPRQEPRVGAARVARRQGSGGGGTACGSGCGRGARCSPCSLACCCCCACSGARPMSPPAPGNLPAALGVTAGSVCPAVRPRGAPATDSPGLGRADFWPLRGPAAEA